MSLGGGFSKTGIYASVGATFIGATWLMNYLFEKAFIPDDQEILKVFNRIDDDDDVVVCVCVYVLFLVLFYEL